MFIFWLGGLGEKGHAAAEAHGATAAPAPIAGGSDRRHSPADGSAGAASRSARSPWRSWAAISWYANSIPQIESKPPRGAVARGRQRDARAARGRRRGDLPREGARATIVPRHRPEAAAAPDLAGVGARAAKPGSPAPSAKAYLVESLLNPSAFVVEGFPQHHAQRVDKPPIGAEPLRALGARRVPRESSGGTVDVTLDDMPQRRRAPRPAARRGRRSKLPGDPKAGQAVFTGKGACIACHKAGEIGASPVGPDLSQHRQAARRPEYIMSKILDPGVEGHRVRVPAGRDAEDLRAAAHRARSTSTWSRSC